MPPSVNSGKCFWSARFPFDWLKTMTADLRDRRLLDDQTLVFRKLGDIIGGPCTIKQSACTIYNTNHNHYKPSNLLNWIKLQSNTRILDSSIQQLIKNIIQLCKKWWSRYWLFIFGAFYIIYTQYRLKGNREVDAFWQFPYIQLQTSRFLTYCS